MNNGCPTLLVSQLERPRTARPDTFVVAIRLSLLLAPRGQTQNNVSWLRGRAGSTCRSVWRSSRACALGEPSSEDRFLSLLECSPDGVSPLPNSFSMTNSRVIATRVSPSSWMAGGPSEQGFLNQFAAIRTSDTPLCAAGSTFVLLTRFRLNSKSKRGIVRNRISFVPFRGAFLLANATEPVESFSLSSDWVF